jgi:hypothetical protein
MLQLAGFQFLAIGYCLSILALFPEGGVGTDDVQVPDEYGEHNLHVKISITRPPSPVCM